MLKPREIKRALVAFVFFLSEQKGSHDPHIRAYLDGSQGAEIASFYMVLSFAMGKKMISAFQQE